MNTLVDLRNVVDLHPGDTILHHGTRRTIHLIIRQHRDNGFRRLLFEDGTSLFLAMYARCEVVS